MGDFRNCGSTCVFCLVRPIEGNGEPAWRVTAANVGDSRALLLRPNGSFVELTQDHKPSLRKESARIRSAGGTVQNDRTDGELAMSRAIGDFKYKLNPELDALEQKVIALPDIRHEVARPGDRLLVMCDGVVERITNRPHVQLPDTARPQRDVASGSTDNHSAIIAC